MSDDDRTIYHDPLAETLAPEIESKPCPFCAGEYPEAISEQDNPGDEYHHYMFCTDCGAGGPTGDDRVHALELWNIRTVRKKEQETP